MKNGALLRPVFIKLQNAAMVMEAEVLLHVDENGDVKSVTRKDTGEAVRYDILQANSDPSVLHANVNATAFHKDMTLQVRSLLNACVTSGGAFRVIALPNCFYDGRTARGAVHLLKSKSKPTESGWPLSLRYASGVTLVEIERVLPNHTYASIELFKSAEFGRRMQAAIRELHEESGTPPGLISPGHPILASLEDLTAAGYPDDPLTRTFKVNYLNSWKPALKETDFIQIYYSTWDTVNPQTKALCGHGTQDVHFYFALCWHLPEEMAEQLLQIARLNMEDQTWAQLAARKEFERALEISKKAREDIMARFLNRIALEPKRAVKHKFVHTTTDVLVPGITIQGKTKAVSCTGFYSHCAPAHAQVGGIVSMTENSPNQPAYWWHGRHMPDHPGGEAWEMKDLAHAMPVFGPSLKFKRTLAAAEAGGWAQSNGWVKLTPIV